MAVSKRLRYEILRRDNHACRYCGGVAPEVSLTVDHVIPTALGGNDDPTNLVTACRDCNAGKSASSPDAPLVDNVREDAVRWAAAMRASVGEMVEEVLNKSIYIEEFEAEWKKWTRGGKPVELPIGWRQSLDTWRRLGIDILLILDAARDAMTFPRYRDYAPDREFRFMAGIVWKRTEDLNLRTTKKLDDFPDGPYDLDDAYMRGWDDGWNHGVKEGRSWITPSVEYAMKQYVSLSKVVDGDLEVSY